LDSLLPAELFYFERGFDDAHVHVEQAKSHATDDTSNLGCVFILQAQILYQQHRFNDAISEALRASEIFEKLGAARDLEECRVLLQDIEQAMENPFTSGE